MPTWPRRSGVSRPERAKASGSRRSIRPKSRYPERHPASDLLESHPPLSRTCVRSLRYWLSQARFSGFRSIVSGPASYSGFSYPFLLGHPFCLSAFRRAPHSAPFLTLYRPCPPLPFPFLFPPRYLSPFRSCTCCSTNPARIYPSPRAPDPLTSATCFRPLPSMAGPKSVGNGNSKAMAAAQGRGHVVQSIRTGGSIFKSGE